jgi:arylsulfatase A-like enzyme
LHEYSTFLYRDKAVEIIQNANSSVPFFIYLAFQAVHDPYTDVDEHAKGMPKEYLRDGVYDQVQDEVVGHKRRQYAYALSLLDDASSDIYDALEDKGVLNNTYIIFASDNGGCYLSGGKNGPLRGTKGSLFEGKNTHTHTHTHTHTKFPTTRTLSWYPSSFLHRYGYCIHVTYIHVWCN